MDDCFQCGEVGLKSFFAGESGRVGSIGFFSNKFFPHLDVFQFFKGGHMTSHIAICNGQLALQGREVKLVVYHK